jgi:hypothetical protein
MSMNHVFAHRVLLAGMEQSSTSGSEASSLATTNADRARFQRSTIQIDLDDHYNSKVYNTSSPISGQVHITTKRDVRFDHIQILLVGCTKTKVDGLNQPHEVTHTFLKLSMPIPESAYPVPRIMESGETFTLPFNFIIPSQLTVNACNHRLDSELVRDQHLRLPPSVGMWEKDDMAPEMAQVEYAVMVRVYREPELSGPKITVMEASQLIRVLPSSLEDPPLSLSKADKLYKMSKKKSVRKSLLSSKLGKITATAAQPFAAVLALDGRKIGQTTAAIDLSFEPASPDIKPPKISKISAKVVAHTFYSSGTIHTLPDLREWTKQISGERRGQYNTSVALESYQPEGTKWHQQVGGTRRDSGYSSDQPNGLSESDSHSISENDRRRSSTRRASSPVSYNTTLQVPIQLPASKKTFLPTFHSCIVSRVYTLSVSVAVGSSGSTTISLSIPLQIVVEPNHVREDQSGLPSFETAMYEAEADDMLRPRVMSVPDAQYMQTSQLPGYADLRR